MREELQPGELVLIKYTSYMIVYSVIGWVYSKDSYSVGVSFWWQCGNPCRADITIYFKDISTVKIIKEKPND